MFLIFNFVKSQILSILIVFNPVYHHIRITALLILSPKSLLTVDYTHPDNCRALLVKVYFKSYMIFKYAHIKI